MLCPEQRWLAGIPAPECTAYLDDVSTGGDTVPTAWRQTLFMIARSALKGLPLGAHKCGFLKRRVEILGVELAS